MRCWNHKCWWWPAQEAKGIKQKHKLHCILDLTYLAMLTHVHTSVLMGAQHDMSITQLVPT
jgi:hypothetical protein